PARGDRGLRAARTRPRADAASGRRLTGCRPFGLRLQTHSARSAGSRYDLPEAARHRPRLRRPGPGLRSLARRAPEPLGADRPRRARPDAEHAPADHGAGVDGDDVEPRPRRARLLRLPKPEGP